MIKEVLELLEKATGMIREMESGTEVCTGAKESKVELSTMNPGEVIDCGERKYIVLKQMDGQTVIISKDLMAEDKQFDSNCTNYGESSLKALIEKDIQPLIEHDFGADNLVEHEVDLTTVDMQKIYPNVKCKVRPITFDEAREFNDLIAAPEIGDWWWTCTPWSTEARGWKYSLAVVCPSGDFNLNGGNDGNGVRPVCILKSNIFVSKGEK